jgi:tetratricopeptide (TPR) repeat protein
MSSDFEVNDLAIVQHYFEIGHYKKAEELMLKLLENSPENPQYLYFMSNIQFNVGNMDLAEEFCLESLGSGAFDEQGYYLLGLINIERKNYVEAEKNLLDSLHINPENPRVLARYGYLMLLTGYDQKAEKLILEALRVDPDDPVVLEISFQYYLVKNKKEQQLQFLHKYIQHSNNEIGKLAKIGLTELLQNNYKGARESFVQAFLLDPTDMDLLSAIQEIDKDYHPIFLPQRIIRKIGGPVIIWIGFIVSLFVLKLLDLLNLAIVLAVIYILICIYTWITPFIYKYFFKR